MSKKIILMIMLIIMIISIGGSAFATEAPADNTDTTLPNVFTENSSGEINAGIPNITIDDVTEWSDRKGHEIITLFQRFAQPFSIIMFIACAIITLIGAFGDSRLVSRGISGMAISVIVYAVILNAQKIVDIFLNFLSN